MIKHMLIALSFLAITACGGADNDNDGNPAAGCAVAVVKEGQFLGSPVAGLVYVSGSQSGVTDNNGAYQYEEGATIQFSIGGIVIGEAPAKSVMTPMDLVQGASSELDPAVTNIGRFLQTLDNDANPDNGITITELVRIQAAGKSLNFDLDIVTFENDGNVQTVVSELTSLTEVGERSLISSQQVQSHLNRALLVRRISHMSPQGVIATADIGIWMFERDELSMAAIADWLNRGLEGRRLLEPINVLWTDFTSVTAQEARVKVTSFLENSGFFTEALHSSGYYGFYNDFSGNGVWKRQYGPSFGDDNTVTWVDTEWPNENNHGRIFPSVRVDSTSGAPVYITSGAFSRESECTNLSPFNICMTGHDYISFNIARDAMHVSGGWEESTKLRVGNEYPPNLVLSFTTGPAEHHDGVRVFALYPFTVTIISPANGASFVTGVPISFEGSVIDSKGLPMPGVELTWTSSIDGIIGEGNSFSRTDLSVGMHTVTLTATDKSGAVGNANVTITVGNIPNIIGEYAGVYTICVDNCSDPESNGIYDFSVNISIDNQNENSFSGTAIGTTSDFGPPVSEHITLSGTIDATGKISGDTSHTFLGTAGVGTFSGRLSTETLSIINRGHDTFGDVCTYTRKISAVR